MTTKTTDPQRIIARFVPQAWVGGNAINVDPEGETEFDVTDHVLSMPREDALALRNDSYESDDLRDLPTAPEWARSWPGPFYIDVERVQ